MPYRSHKTSDSIMELGAQFNAVFEEIKGMSCEDVLKLFGFMMDATKPASSVVLENSPGARKKKRFPGTTNDNTNQTLTGTAQLLPFVPIDLATSIEDSDIQCIEDQTSPEVTVNKTYVKSVLSCVKAFNGGSIRQHLIHVKSLLSEDICYRMPFSSDVLKGRVVLVLMSALLYYTYPDGVLEVESFKFLTDEECLPHDISPTRGCRFTIKFSGTAVSRRPVQDMISHIGEKASRVKLTSIVSHCKERRIAAAGIASASQNDVEVEESGKCYAELFLRAAELAAFGVKAEESDEIQESEDSTVVEENRLNFFLGFNAKGQLDYWLVAALSS